MNETTLLMARLADGCYADLTSPDQSTRQAALRTRLNALSEAKLLADKFEMTQLNHAATGLSATVFRDRSTNEVTLAVRGTDGGADYLVDGLLVLGAAAELNAQFMVLKDWIEAWSQPTVSSEGAAIPPLLPPSFRVTGHSLGGHLASAVKAAYPERAGEAYLFNAPGVGTVFGSAASFFQQAFGTSPPGSQGVFNIRRSRGA